MNNQERPVERKRAFGQNYTKSVPDMVGIWLSGYRVRRWIPSFKGKAIGDFGCGYDTQSRALELGFSA